jgi:hypothetical protein
MAYYKGVWENSKGISKVYCGMLNIYGRCVCMYSWFSEGKNGILDNILYNDIFLFKY